MIDGCRTDHPKRFKEVNGIFRAQVLWQAIDEIVKDGPFDIGVSGDQPMPIYVKNNLHNVLDFGVVGPWAPATPGNQVVAQWYFDPPQS